MGCRDVVQILLLVCSFSTLVQGRTYAQIEVILSIKLVLPTSNTALFSDDYSLFYQKTARSGPDAWQAGRYGLVRNKRNLKQGAVFTRFHEGVDIRPVQRDARGNPLDSVVAIDDGIIVHVNGEAGGSNYGKYIVVEHVWGGSPYYSLYAHLNEIWAEAGQRVLQGQEIGRLGYTGAGINRERAHLHLEITMLLNSQFSLWFNNNYSNEANHHGIYNGMNLVGMDVERLYLELKEKPWLTIEEFLAEEKPFYSVIVPRTGRLNLLGRYAWLQDSSAGPEDQAWRITFNASGIPLRVEPLVDSVSEPTLEWVNESDIPYQYATKYRIRGVGKKHVLTASGKRYVQLVATAGTAPGDVVDIDTIITPDIYSEPEIDEGEEGDTDIDEHIYEDDDTREQ